jgi:hypothetical protein
MARTSRTRQGSELRFSGGENRASPAHAAVVALATQGQGLKALDKTKPIGVAVFLDATTQQPKALIFLGATDAKALIAGLPMLQAQEKDGGWEIQSPQGIPSKLSTFSAGKRRFRRIDATDSETPMRKTLGNSAASTIY